MPLVADRAGVGRIDRHIASKQETNTPTITFAITPSDTADLQQDIRALYVGVSGNVTVIDKYGNSRAYVGLAAGTWQPIHARRVMATGTTATSIVGGV